MRYFPPLLFYILLASCVGPFSPSGEPLEAIRLHNTTGDTASVWVTIPYDIRTGRRGATDIISGYLAPHTDTTLSPGEGLPHPAGGADRYFGGYSGGVEVSISWESDRRDVDRWVEGPVGPVLVVRVTEGAIEVKRTDGRP